MPAHDKVNLIVAGTVYSGWTDVDIERSIERFAGSFTIALTERWPGQASARPIKPGRPCQVKIGDDLVITGYTDDYMPRIDSETHSVSISGRDKTGDLVDCSAIHKSGQWKKIKLERIATDLCKPFGISVITATDTGKAFPSFNVEEGESVFECLDRAARQRAVLLTSDAAGNLLITRASGAVSPGALIEGQNVLSAEGQFSWKDRHSRYTIKSQEKSGEDYLGGPPAKKSGASAAAADTSVDRYRPLIVISEDHGAGVTMAQRASYEQRVRMGRSNRAVVTVQGWRRPDGKLWQPNTLVSVKSPSLALDSQMLIAGCKYSLRDKSTTTLTLVRKEAFDLIPQASGKKKPDNDMSVV
ncbi:MAG: phage tail protein [Oxalobacter sp.]|nr:MAG: phage tail protein [Oxalobacter sp.]